MARYLEMDRNEIESELRALRTEYEKVASCNLKLNMSRGKPSAAQLDLSADMLSILSASEDCFSEDGTDCRNYGVLDGIPEAKRLMSVLLDENPENVIVLGNSSLTAMHDCIARCLDFGCLGSLPWALSGNVKFICPVPGYDRHFSILEQFGIEMLPVPLREGYMEHVCEGDVCWNELQGAGPDMDQVERMVAEDDQIKGIWCVPKYSNPSGITYSDDVVRRLASMKCAADDFRIFWDNAYSVHDLYSEPALQDSLLDIGTECAKAGNPNRYFKFASTSKITFPGAGISAFASSPANVEEAKRLINAQMIGSDKLNQLRHVRFLGGADAEDTTVEAFAEGISAHMQKQAAILRPKFALVQKKLEAGLGGLGIASWTNPKGGYFVCFNGLEGTAAHTVALAHDAGVTLTSAGATWPYRLDPRDSDIRIAPTMPTIEELGKALDVFICCAKIAALEVLH